MFSKEGERRNNGGRNRAGSALSESGGRQVWHGQQGQGSLSVSAKQDGWPDISTHVGVSGLYAGGETAEGGDAPQWERHPGYRPGPACWTDHGEQGIKKKLPDSRR